MSHGYLPYIILPTRIIDFSTTCIDHIFVKDVTKESRTGKKHDEILSGMFYCDISDHLPFFLALLCQRATNNNRPLIRIFGEKNILKFKISMIEENWEDIYTDGTDWFAQFISVVKNKFETNFPMVRVSRKRAHDKPWITSGLKRSIKTNNRLYKLSIHRGDPNTNYKYKNYKNLFRKCIKAAQDLYYHNLFSDAKISTFNLWKHLGSLINPRKKRKPLSIAKILRHGDTFKEAKILQMLWINIFVMLERNYKLRFQLQMVHFIIICQIELNKPFP